LGGKSLFEEYGTERQDRGGGWGGSNQNLRGGRTNGNSFWAGEFRERETKNGGGKRIEKDNNREGGGNRYKGASIDKEGRAKEEDKYCR